MAKKDWWRPMTQEESNRLEKLVYSHCTGNERGGCSITRYGVDMCPGCSSYFVEGAKIFGITPEQYIADVLEDLPPIMREIVAPTERMAKN